MALTPGGVRELIAHGHEVAIQTGAGAGSSIPDDAYEAQGPRIVANAEAIFRAADPVVKVKEPQKPEIALLEPRHALLSYLHLAPDAALTRGLADSGARCIAYETVENGRGGCRCWRR